MEEQKFDKRLIERRIRSGILARDEYEKHIKALPDGTANVAVIEANIDAVRAERESAAAED